MIKQILKPLRIDHWTKNLVLVVGYFFSLFFIENNNDLDFTKLILGFLTLCISASSNYLINEYLDKKFDKFHPQKKVRTFVKKTNDKNIFYKYIILILTSFFLSLFINYSFVVLNIIFLFFGILYNVEPFRFKNTFLIDVLLEAANNPLRFLMGWSILIPNYYPPISIVLFFWLVGCFLMTMKRYSEYNFLSKRIDPTKYRKSFKTYNSQNLFDLSILYSLLSFFFFAIFIIKYKLELILLSPVTCLIYIRIFKISQKKNSIIMNVEKIYKDTKFVYLVFFSLLFSIVLLQFDISILKVFEQKELYPIK